MYNSGVDRCWPRPLSLVETRPFGVQGGKPSDVARAQCCEVAEGVPEILVREGYV